MLKVLELFGGIGAPRKALERLGKEFEVVDYVDIDKYAVKSYNAIYNENYEPQDITTWDKQLDAELIFHGSPCQDFSLAGKQAGGDKDSGTRSSLLYETVRIVENLKPKYVIWENVKNVISKKHRHNFDNYLQEMEKLGYTNYYQVLNAKDYGIPQNRERVFTISIKNEIDKDNVEILDIFKFPAKQELKLRLKDILEDEVEEKYYLSNKMINYILARTPLGEHHITTGIHISNKESEDIAGTICTEPGNKPSDNYILDNEDITYDKKLGGLAIKEYRNYISWEDSKGRINTQDHRAFKDDCISGTVPAMERGIPKVIMPEATAYLRIRKLTPLEVWRLMGFDDSDYEKASQVNSNSQLYKQAGNSIVVNVLEAIFKELL